MDTFDEGPFPPARGVNEREWWTQGEERESSPEAATGHGWESFDESPFPPSRGQGEQAPRTVGEQRETSSGAATGNEWEGFDESESGESDTEGEAPRGRTGGTHATLRRGSRGPEVVRAQTLLNTFLRRIVDGPQICVDRSPGRVGDMRGMLFSLRRNGQLPLVVDGKFGANTENATRLFQTCRGLARDGIVGNVTWTYLEGIPGRRRRRNPPDTAGCGVPERPSAELEAELDLELELLGETQRRTAPVVRPALSLFMNASTTSHRNHFECQASRTARTMGAYANPRADRCAPRRVGPTAFDTGADIVTAISAAHSCLERRIAKVHIFGHSGSYGVFGSTPGANGMYLEVDATDRATGARTITDIPVGALANDVVVVLHGCNQAAGTGSFAESLYRHLAATLTSPLVFGHPNSGCAGRDNSWRRFDARTPSGRAVASIAPHYSGGGCCTPAPRREAEAPQLEVAAEWETEGAVTENEWESSASQEPVMVGGSRNGSARPCGCQH